MVDQQLLSKVIKEAMKSGRYSLGTKEVISEMKGSKLVICTKSLSKEAGEKLRAEAGKNNVNVIDIPKSSSELGKMVGRPFRISAMSLRSVGDQELKQLAA
jgi:large subunit ribosomal protein L30e